MMNRKTLPILLATAFLAVGVSACSLVSNDGSGGELDGVARLDNFHLQVTHFPEPGQPRLDDFQLQGTPFPDPPPPPTAQVIIGGNVRNGDFNGSL